MKELSIQDGEPQQPAPSSQPAGLDQIFLCLGSKNDTQRFVGLTLLMKYLEGIQNNHALIIKCWTAIPLSFISRLLRANTTKNENSPGEAQTKVELGVTVLHTFVSLLPPGHIESLFLWDYPKTTPMNDKTGKIWLKIVNSLVVDLPSSPPKINIEILQILSSLAATEPGAGLLFPTRSSIDWGLVLDEIFKQTLIFDMVLAMVQTVANTDKIPPEDIIKGLNLLFCKILEKFNPETSSTKDLLQWFYGILGILPQPILEDPVTLEWLNPLINVLRTSLTTSKRTEKGLRDNVVRVARFLVDIEPAVHSDIPLRHVLFNSSAKSPFGVHAPLSYLFTTSLLIDIRSTLPSLPAIFPTPDYTSVSLRLSSSYDLVFVHLNLILEASESDSASGSDSEGPALEQSREGSTVSLPSDFILKLRDQISATMALTTESLHDRYDACANNATAIHAMAEDSLVISQMGAISFWLDGDDAAYANDLLEVALRLYACKTQIARLCTAVLSSIGMEGTGYLEKTAGRALDDMVGITEDTRQELRTLVRDLDAANEGTEALDDDDDNDDENEGDGYDYD
ncbi:hypothetical protein MMC19_004763 [Ptychographa xylographoides]|nr:hypothetical protein [Ptychographa xylographoides]